MSGLGQSLPHTDLQSMSGHHSNSEHNAFEEYFMPVPKGDILGIQDEKLKKPLTASMQGKAAFHVLY